HRDRGRFFVCLDYGDRDGALRGVSLCLLKGSEDGRALPGLALNVQWQALDDDVRGLRTIPVLEPAARLDAEDVAQPARDHTLPVVALASGSAAAHWITLTSPTGAKTCANRWGLAPK